MLDQTAAAFNLRIDHDLNLNARPSDARRAHGAHSDRRDPRAGARAPDAVLVHGDTTTALALALASFYRQIPVGHVEAGLRSGNRYSPFPEEMNRRLISSLSTWHYAPTEGNRANLLAQGVDPDSIRVTGNTVIDALLETVSSSYRSRSGSRSGRFRRIARLGVDVPSAREPGRTDGAHVRCSTRHGRRPR